MSLSLILACLWLVAANVIGMFPSRRHHWPAVYGLIATGLPLLVYVIWQNGPWWGLAFFILAASVLRWPLIYLGRWIMRVIRVRQP